MEEGKYFIQQYIKHIYIATDVWLRTLQIMIEETCSHNFIGSKGFLYMYHPTDRILHATACFLEHWLEQKIVKYVH